MARKKSLAALSEKIKDSVYALWENIRETPGWQGDEDLVQEEKALRKWLAKVEREEPR